MLLNILIIVNKFRVKIKTYIARPRVWLPAPSQVVHIGGMNM